MSKLLIEDYIKEFVSFLNEDSEQEEYSLSDPGEYSDNDRPTFGDIKAFVNIAKITNGKAMKFAISFASHFAGAQAIGSALDAANISHDKISDDTVDAVAGALEKVFGFKLTSFSPTKILAKMYGVNDKKGFELIQIPSEVSNLIDDKIETNFISHLYKEILKKDNNEEIPDDFVLNTLKEFTKKNKKTKGHFVSKL
tara:strand:- start:423 stop:1013 length:591 start_codon:yes stop_codon:yes gene_type:complete